MLINKKSNCRLSFCRRLKMLWRFSGCPNWMNCMQRNLLQVGRVLSIQTDYRRLEEILQTALSAHANFIPNQWQIYWQAINHLLLKLSSLLNSWYKISCVRWLNRKYKQSNQIDNVTQNMCWGNFDNRCNKNVSLYFPRTLIIHAKMQRNFDEMKSQFLEIREKN